MSAKYQRLSRASLIADSDKIQGNITRIDHNFVLEIVIGTCNIKRWNQLKITFSCSTNEELATFLLDLAEKYSKENTSVESTLNSIENVKEPAVPEETKTAQTNEVCRGRRKRKRTRASKNYNPQLASLSEITVISKTVEDSSSSKFIKDDENKTRKNRRKRRELALEKQKKQNAYDIRKAPELNEQIININHNNINSDRVAIKIKLCCMCDKRHVQDHCPLEHPHFIVTDSLEYDEWLVKYENDQELSDENSYAQLSLPTCLYLVESNVFTAVDIKEFTQFGPLKGKIVKEVDISEEFDLKYLWCIYGNSDKTNNIYVNAEEKNEANWIRFVKPAPTRNERNIMAVTKNEQLYLITVKSIEAGEELLYWQNDNLNFNKKKMEKTICGGCNMTFAHALYYRLHCSIFHDLRYSLTIRKYHCKICGAAVLGKENIMKHAQDLHNGQGAYQCQFCKKFFLRLNYLDMHRTYGCSANPHRSRPLCDFCGQKFCQPQKLKVHIKRMHSDLADVLRDFQCKKCNKILGSRAALQRHMKEVHNKEMTGASTCCRCGKFFQNKSNLKIHMLTHSGIKPFRCAEDGCNAAFTTKQCLQFHYKKVHGFTDDVMPKIKRSVDYTFEAYSGDQDTDGDNNMNENQVIDCNDSIIDLNESSDIDNDNGDDIDENDNEDQDINDMDDKSTEANNTLINITSPASENSDTDMAPHNQSILGPFTNTNLKILSKGSKKWLGEQPLTIFKSYQIDHKGNTDIVDEPAKLGLTMNAYGRHHESSNASLLVEAALDSVIDVDSTPAGTEALVNNLCTSLTHPDSLSDVPYNNSDDIEDSRDINLISPSVNEAISVTDGENIGIDYSNFHHNDFTPTSSPNLQQREQFNRDYIDVGNLSPKNITPGSSPPRYNFGHGINVEHVSSDESNGIGVQNLSLHGKNEAQLDLSIYKTPTFDFTNFQLRKDVGMKLNVEGDRKHVYLLEINDKLYHEGSLNEDHNMSAEAADRDQVTNFETSICNKDFEDIDNVVIKYKEMRTKYDIPELNLRSKSYEPNSSNDALRRTSYDGTDADFRIKGYEDVVEPEFRIDRNFEPLELQGLDMSARSYHNFHTSSNLNRYHHLYPDMDRPPLYSPPLPTYSHADVLRVVSLDLTSPGRHSVDLSLRSNPLHVHQLGSSRLLTEHNIQTNRILTLDQNRLLSAVGSELPSNRHISGSRILSDHSTNRLLSNEQLSTNHLISSEPNRLISDESRLLSEQARLLSGSGAVSPPPYNSYAVSSAPYHPTALAARNHANSSPTPYHHYSSYY